MNLTYRLATEEDFSGILKLVQELAVFEKEPNAVTNTIDQMKTEQDLFNCFVVENSNKEIIAIALYFFAYSTWVGKMLYLEDLYVKPDYRGHKIGSELLRKIILVAQEENCKRVRWQVLNWNKPALEFYRKVGAKIDNEWSNCDLDEQAIKKFKY